MRKNIEEIKFETSIMLFHKIEKVLGCTLLYGFLFIIVHVFIFRMFELETILQLYLTNLLHLRLDYNVYHPELVRMILVLEELPV